MSDYTFQSVEDLELRLRTLELRSKVDAGTPPAAHAAATAAGLGAALERTLPAPAPAPAAWPVQRSENDDPEASAGNTAAWFSIPRVLLHPSASSQPHSSLPQYGAIYPSHSLKPHGVWEGDKSRALLAMNDQVTQLKEALAEASRPSENEAPLSAGATPPPRPPPVSSYGNIGGAYGTGNIHTARPAQSSSGVLPSYEPVKYYPAQSATTVGEQPFTPLPPHVLGPGPGGVGTTYSVSGGAGVVGVSGVDSYRRPPLLHLSTNTGHEAQLVHGRGWEGRQAAALIAMEEEKLALLRRIDAFEGIRSEHARELKSMVAKHKEELTDQRELFQQKLRDSAGIAGRRLQSMYNSAWIVFQRRRTEVYRLRAFWYWRQMAQQSRKLRWAEGVWRRRMLAQYFMEWSVEAASSRRSREVEAAAIEREHVRQEQLSLHKTRFLLRWHLSHLATLLTAWQERTGVQVAKRWRRQQADRFLRMRHLATGLYALRLHVSMEQADAVGVQLEGRLSHLRLGWTFRAWVLINRLHHLSRRNLKLRYLKSWQWHTRHMGAVKNWSERRTSKHLAQCLGAWQLEAGYMAQLGKAADALKEAIRRICLQRCLCYLWGRARSRAKFHAVIHSNHREVLLAWLEYAQKWARHRRVLDTWEDNMSAQRLWVSLLLWRLMGMRRRLRIQGEHCASQEARVSDLQQGLTLEKIQSTAALDQTSVLEAEIKALALEARRGLVMSAAGGFLSKELTWRPLPVDADPLHPIARCRHAALLLPLLQGGGWGRVAGGAGTESCSLIPSLSAVVVVFGGISGEAWYRDVSLLSISQSDSGSLSVDWEAALPEPSHAPAGPQLLTAGTAEPPPHLRDYAACAVGPDCFLVIGGFDGSTEVNHMQLFTVKQAGQQVAADVDDMHAAGLSEEHGFSSSYPNSGGHGAGGAALMGTTSREGDGLVARPELVEDDMELPLPPNDVDGVSDAARNHHQAGHGLGDGMGAEGGGGGGRSDRNNWSHHNAAATPTPVVPRGPITVSWRLLEARSRCPSPRSHHTASYDPPSHSVVIFGGYASGRGLLNELWSLNMESMEWWQPNTTGDQPPRRRGHISALVGGKLYVHGGLGSSNDVMGDLWCLDLSTWHWALVIAMGLVPPSRRGHAADVVAGRYIVLHGGYDGFHPLSDCYTYDTVNNCWAMVEIKGGGRNNESPTPRSMHSLTCIGESCVLIGGSGPLGPLGDAHLLESPGVREGIIQQRVLVDTQRMLSSSRMTCSRLQADLQTAVCKEQSTKHQLHVIQSRASDLVLHYNQALERVSTLKDELEAVQLEMAEAEKATAASDLKAATFERRLCKAREGGRMVAAAAEEMHGQLYGSRLRAAELEHQLGAAMGAAEAAQAAALHLSAERQLLQTQLAAVSNEAGMLRHMLATAEAEYKAAPNRSKVPTRPSNFVSRKMQPKVSERNKIVKNAKRPKTLAAKLAGPGGDPASAEGPDSSTRVTSFTPPSSQAASEAASEAADSGGQSFVSSRDSQYAMVELELRQAQARTHEARVQLELMQKDYTAMAGDLAAAKHKAVKETAAQEAADEMASDAVQQMHRLEFRYQQVVEDLEHQVKTLHRERRASEIGSQHGSQMGSTMSPHVSKMPSPLGVPRRHLLWSDSLRSGTSGTSGMLQRPPHAAAAQASSHFNDAALQQQQQLHQDPDYPDHDTMRSGPLSMMYQRPRHAAAAAAVQPATHAHDVAQQQQQLHQDPDYMDYGGSMRFGPSAMRYPQPPQAAAQPSWMMHGAAQQQGAQDVAYADSMRSVHGAPSSTAHQWPQHAAAATQPALRTAQDDAQQQSPHDVGYDSLGLGPRRLSSGSIVPSRASALQQHLSAAISSLPFGRALVSQGMADLGQHPAQSNRGFGEEDLAVGFSEVSRLLDIERELMENRLP